MRCLDVVDENDGKIGDRNYRIQTRNRDKWKKPLRKARAQPENSSQWRW
jgi:hypothetical protein